MKRYLPFALGLLLGAWFASSAHAAVPTINNQPPEQSPPDGTSVTTFTINLPASIPDNSLCLVTGSGDGSGDFIDTTEDVLDFDANVAFPADADSNAGGTWRYSTWSPCGSADQGGSFDVTVTSGENGAFFVTVIEGWDGMTPPSYSAATENASSNSCDAPAVTTWSGEDALVFWFVGRDPQNWDVTAFPTNFPDNHYEDTVDESLDTLTMATTTTTAASVDPANATLGATGSNACWAVAIRGTADGSAPVISSPTPSGTLATQTTATLGATSDDNTGTFYGVVDDSAGIMSITASQIKLGNDSGDATAIASCNAAVSTTSPSCGVTGLTANTAYSYAVVHTNATGDSNVETGTFTTAEESSTAIAVLDYYRRLLTQ